jgi:hypothetical protein
MSTFPMCSLNSLLRHCSAGRTESQATECCIEHRPSDLLTGTS